MHKVNPTDKCSVCRQETHYSFSHSVLGKYSCNYYLCGHCGLLYVHRPHWLEEAYSEAIARTDTGLVARNLSIAKALSPLLFRLFGRSGSYLDVAGGCGLLTRLMRDRGFDYHWSDKYCANLLAPGFEGNAATRYCAVTCFEVLEHLVDPVSFIENVLSESGAKTIIFSTLLFSGDAPPRSWWYYAFETGQHISFFQRKTLAYIADKLNLYLYSYGSLHMLTDNKSMGALGFRLLTSRWSNGIAGAFVSRLMTSRTQDDHLAMEQNLRSYRDGRG